MADTTAFRELAAVIEMLDSMGIPVEADTHVERREIDGERHTVADLTIMLDETPAEQDDEDDLSIEDVRTEIQRYQRELMRGMGGRHA